MINLNNLTVRFGAHVVLNNIQHHFERGKAYGISGRNGTGKTVLLKTIIGFVKPTEGSVIVNGKTIGKDEDFLKDAGIIIETPGFLPNFTGLKNLQLLAGIHQVGDAQVYSAIEAVGLQPENRQPVREYSLGMRQKLGIAQAIMEHPSVLLLDEPFSSLDSKSVLHMQSLFVKLKSEGVTMVLVSHNTDEIKDLCDAFYNVEEGKLALTK